MSRYYDDIPDLDIPDLDIHGEAYEDDRDRGPDPNEERARLEREEHDRLTELLDAPTDRPSYATDEEWRAMIEAARASDEEEGS